MQKPRFNSSKKSPAKGTGPSRKKESDGPASSNRGKRGASSSERPARPSSPRGDKRSSGDERPQRSTGPKSYGEKRGYGKEERSERPSSPRSYGEKRGYGKEERPSRPSSSKGYGAKKSSSYGDRDNRSSSYSDRSEKGGYGDRKPSAYGDREKRPYTEKREKGFKVIGKDGRTQFKKTNNRKPPVSTTPRAPRKEGEMRLNKFLSNAGIASRRDADQLIELGLVTVNGKVVTEMGYKVNVHTDVVKYDDKSLRPEKLRYVLLNKPKDYITTMDDPEERKTVMFLIKDACVERIYPVGRLDRQTTGLLLFTNDGELAKKLTHPRYGVQKLYHVETMEKVKGTDLDTIRKGVKLEDGLIVPDEVSFVAEDQHQVGIKIHSGKNRVVRRIFEKMNYTVKKLDRVMFAGLTKKDLSRGRYRHLSEQEVAFLKMIK